MDNEQFHRWVFEFLTNCQLLKICNYSGVGAAASAEGLPTDFHRFSQIQKAFMEIGLPDPHESLRWLIPSDASAAS